MKKYTFFLFIVFGFAGLKSNAQIISSLSPSSSNAGQTLDVTITGCGTTFTQGTSTAVSFSCGTVNSYNLINDTSIIANISIPSNAYTGYYNVSVYDPTDGTLNDYNSFYVNGICHPNITTLSPSSSNAGQTLDVTITGCGTTFTQGTSTAVSFSCGTVNSYTVVSTTSINASVSIPSNTYTGNYNVRVYDPTDGTLNDNSFYVNGICYPNITTLSPSSSNAGQTLDVTITGCGTTFTQGTSTAVSFGCGTVNSYTVVSTTSINANITIPSNTYTGYYNVSAYDPTDGILYDNGGFYVNGICHPNITTLSPSSSNAGQTLDVTITGCGTTFMQGSSTAVTFGCGTVNSYTVVNTTSINANITIPSNTYTGYYNVSAYDPTDGILYDNGGFYVNGICHPNITTLSPSSSNAGQTLDVTITGCGTTFTQGSSTAVTFACGTVNSYTVVNTTSINANITIPSNTYTGYYNVSVYDPTDGILNDNGGFYVNGISSSCRPTGVTNIKVRENMYTIYPNPSAGKFTIQTSNGYNSITNAQIKMYNCLGENIYQAKLYSDKTQINISTKPTGIYFYRIIGQSGKLLEQGKVIVAH